MIYAPHGMKRREFLGRVGTFSLGTALAGSPSWLAEAEEAKPSNPVDVGIARGSSMEDAVRSAVTLIGGLDFIQADQTVLIKPNVTGRGKYPTTTNPEVLYAVIKLAAERGPKRIIVADRCFSASFTTETPKTIDVMKDVGHLDAVNQAISDAKAPVVAVGLERAAEEFVKLGKPRNTPHWRKIKPTKATHWPNGFELAELLFAVDHVINVPVIKTHFQTWYTMAMKSFVGMSHHRARKEFHSVYTGGNDLSDQKRTRGRRRGHRRRSFDAQIKEAAPLVNRITELNLGLKPAINILDGTRSFVFGGPSHGDTVDPKLIVATRDRVAADATGVAVLKRYGCENRLQKNSVWKTPFIRYAVKIGLGVDGPEKIHLKHKDMDADIETIRKMLA